MKYFSFVALSCLMITIKYCNGKYINAKRVWDEQRRVCDLPIETLSNYRLYDIGFPEKRFPDVGSIKTERHKIVTSSLRTRIQNQTSFENFKHIDQNEIVITYEDFRCCIKKSWLNEMKIASASADCMNLFLKCILATFEKSCKLENRDYLKLAFSHKFVAFIVMLTGAAIVTTFYILRGMYFHNVEV